MKARMRAIAVLIAVLLLGCLIGAAGSWLRYGKYGNVRADEKQEDSPLMSGRYEQRLPELLGMTSEQKARFEDIMKGSRRELDALSREQRLKINAVIEQANKEILSILENEQKAKLETFLNDVNRRRDRGSRGERGSRLPKRGHDQGGR